MTNEEYENRLHIAVEAFKAVSHTIEKVQAYLTYEIVIPAPEWIMIDGISFDQNQLMTEWLKEKKKVKNERI